MVNSMVKISISAPLSIACVFIFIFIIIIISHILLSHALGTWPETRKQQNDD